MAFRLMFSWFGSEPAEHEFERERGRREPSAITPGPVHTTFSRCSVRVRPKVGLAERVRTRRVYLSIF